MWVYIVIAIVVLLLIYFSRGVYPEMWNDLVPYVSSDVDGVADMIKNYKFGSAYQYIKDTYCFKDNVNQLMSVIDRALASSNQKKRVMYVTDGRTAFDADSLRRFRRAAELGSETYLLIDADPAKTEELLPLKVELAGFQYIDYVIIKDGRTIEDILEKNRINLLVVEDTLTNRSAYEKLSDNYEIVFLSK